MTGRSADLEYGSPLYAHIADDGGIFTIVEDTGWEARPTLENFASGLVRLKSEGGMLRISLEHPEVLDQILAGAAEAGAPDPELLSLLPPVSRNALEVVLSAGVAVRSASIRPEAKVPEGDNMLGIAAWAGKDDYIESLLARGVDLEATDNLGRSALSRAALGNRASTISLLSSVGADLERRDHKEMTALHLAAHFGHSEAARALIEAGADLHAVADGWDPARFARANRYIELADELQRLASP